MQLQAERCETDRLQPPVNHGQCCHLFRDKQHRFALTQRVGNDVGDGLALAGARRAFQHQIATGSHRAQRFHLRRIGQQRREDVLGLESLVQIHRHQVGVILSRKGLTWVLDEVLYNAVGLQLLGAVLQVFPHQILGEREQAEMGLLDHFPMLDFSDREPERLQHALDIHTAFIHWQGFQPRDAQLEIGLEELQQCRVDDGFVIVARKPETGPHRLPLKRDRDQQNRRQVAALRAFVFRPAQQAERDVKRVGTALLQAGTGSREDAKQSLVEFLALHIRKQLAVAKRAQRHVVERSPPAPAGVHLRHARVLTFHQRGPRPDLEVFPISQRILQQGETRSSETQGGLRGLEVQQLVAQRQVEQPGLPFGEPPFGRVVHRQVHHHRGHVQFREHRCRLDARSDILAQLRRSFHHRHTRRQGLNLDFARAMNVDGIPEHIFRQQMRTTGLHRDAQAGPLTVVRRNARGFEDQQLTTVDTFAHGLNIIRQRIRKARLVQPDADPCMAVLEQHHRAQTGLLETRCEEHRQIKAGR